METTIGTVNKLPPFQGLNIRNPIIIPVKGRGFINQRSTLNPRLGRYAVMRESFPKALTLNLDDLLTQSVYLVKGVLGLQ